jgi:hypothetical protein
MVKSKDALTPENILYFAIIYYRRHEIHGKLEKEGEETDARQMD